MNFLPEIFTDTWTLVVLVIVLSTIYAIAPYRVFKRIGIRGPTPWPFIGSYFKYKMGILDFYTECHQKYGKVWGIYEGRKPFLFVMDTGMIRTIFVKEGYTVFLNRPNHALVGFLSNSLPLMRDEQWKRVHKIVSSVFSSGRIKEMFPIMLHHSPNLIRNIYRMENHDSVDIRKILEPFTLDISLGIFFSVDVESLNNPSSPFIHYIQEVNKYNYLNFWLLLSIVFPIILPVLDKMNITVNSSEALSFFKSFIKTVKEERKTNPTDRVDFMQLMLNAQIPDGIIGESGLTDEEITVQALTFAIVGNGNMANGLAFTAYNLAVHPHVQAKLLEEIDRTFPGQCQPAYEGLLQMKYLDMVLMETLRMYPITNRMDRVAACDVEVSGVIIPKGMSVSVPLYTLHHDPDVWPDPESFKPERFSKNKKDNIDPYSFLTFGTGPRSCTGMLISMLVMKLALVEILQCYRFVPCKETNIPLVLSRSGFVLPEKPIMLKLVPREPAA